MRAVIGFDDPTEPSVLGSEDLSPENPSELFSGESHISLEDPQPDPVHVFRLWQIFLERVHPLLKVIHAPSLQSDVMQAASDISKLSLNHRALIYAILTMATISLSETEVIETLGISRELAIYKFTLRLKDCLVRFNFLKNYDMASLQTLVLYMVWRNSSFINLDL